MDVPIPNWGRPARRDGMNGLVYVLSWMQAGPAVDAGENAGTSFGRAWEFTFQWGWPGLVVCSFAPAVSAWGARMREAARPTPRRFGLFRARG